MAERLQVYKCDKCGSIVEVLHGGGGTLVCCGDPMSLLEEKTADAATEKHVPVIEKVDGGFLVKVHYIEWIELIADGAAYRRFLNPGDAPEATFAIDAEQVTAREHCNVHGLWKG